MILVIIEARMKTPNALASKLLKGGLYRGLYLGAVWGLLRGILGVWMMALMTVDSWWANPKP